MKIGLKTSCLTGEGSLAARVCSRCRAGHVSVPAGTHTQGLVGLLSLPLFLMMSIRFDDVLYILCTELMPKHMLNQITYREKGSQSRKDLRHLWLGFITMLVI